MNAPATAAAPLLPPALAAALDAAGSVLVTHPRTGATLRLSLDRTAEGEAGSEYRSGRTLAQAVEAGLADAEAGRTMSMAEFRAEMGRRQPALKRLLGGR